MDLSGPANELVRGDYRMCARLTRGPVLCWGENYGGELGVGVPPCAQTPIRVEVGDAEPQKPAR